MNGGTWGIKWLGWVLCGALMMCPKAVAMAQASGEICYVALGDSISSGFGLKEEHQRFTQQVARENGFDLVSLAQNGETSATLLERLQDPEVMQAVAQADVISITVGGNDLMQSLYEYLAHQYPERKSDPSPTAEEVQQTLMGGDMAMLTYALGEIQGFPESEEKEEAMAQFTANLTQVTQEIETVNPDVCLVVANQYNPYHYLLQEFSKYPPVAEAAQKAGLVLQAELDTLNDAITSVGEQVGYSVVDVYTAFEDAGENPCNAQVSLFSKLNLDFHPNAYGHTLIAQAVTAVANQQLQAMGHSAQTVSGETRGMTQTREPDRKWQWAVPMGGAALAVLGILWQGRHRCRGQKG